MASPERGRGFRPWTAPRLSACSSQRPASGAPQWQTRPLRSECERPGLHARSLRLVEEGARPKEWTVEVSTVSQT
jgi:hypothetical protein